MHSLTFPILLQNRECVTLHPRGHRGLFFQRGRERKFFIASLQENGCLFLFGSPPKYEHLFFTLAIPLFLKYNVSMQKLLKTRTDLSIASLQRLRRFFARSSPRNLAIFELSLGSGLRRAEVLGLTWEDIHFPERTLQILGKGSKIRIVHFTESAAKALEALPKSPGLIFDILPNTWFKLLRKTAKQLKLPERIHPHCLRHAYALHCIRSGIDVMNLQRALGHSNLATTAVYLHCSDLEAAKNIAVIPEL